MIVFLNGAFGVGKTSTASALRTALPGSVVVDPEWVGSMLMATLADRPGWPDWPGDSQDLAAWRRLVVGTVQELRREVDETLIVPMTVPRMGIWRELNAGVREADADLRAFRLTATEATLRARIVGESEDPHDWRLGHMPAALAAMRKNVFGAETDGRTPREISSAILATL